MKKPILLMAAAFSLFIASCDDESDLGVPQVTPQEAIMSADGLTVAFGEAISGDALNIAQYVGLGVLNPNLSGDMKDEYVPLISVSEVKDLPEGANVQFMMQMAAEEAFSNAKDINLTDGKALGSELNLAFQELYGKLPAPEKVWVRFAAYVVDGSQVSRLGGLDRWYGEKAVTATPVDWAVAETYQLRTFVGGQASTVYTMVRSDKDRYEDPLFSTTFPVDAEAAAAGFSWEIAAVYSSGDVIYYPTEGKDSGKGIISLSGKPETIESAGQYRVEINALDATYSQTLAYEYLNLPGGSNGWNVTAEEWRLTTNDYDNYYGYAWLDGEFKIAAGSWDVNWGQLKDAEYGTLSSGGDNISAPKTGLYYVTMCISKATYQLTEITSLGMIGDFNDWGAQSPLTISDNGLTIKGEMTIPADKGLGWKFRANDNWDINLGGTMQNLVPGGDNLQAEGPGTYEVSLNLANLPYTCSVVKK